ncbi:hypothetical protein POL68_14205 [Stigmatella sp. ncwal1]|uniref:Uncharacterized protein n=1 Tax=Stigmatella ashevillensis TaxID=2995309 RepID=A0ABT5D7I3_9BACT|nr:hypothetical protein [Stigmatella ashevillena]MDC0709620.1 hypothetical protein [Stigmatella ashevillena]
MKNVVEPRMVPEALLNQARELPGNLDRLADVLGGPAVRMLLTLETKSAVFSRGIRSVQAAQVFLCQLVVELKFPGRKFRVAYMAHLGNLKLKHRASRESISATPLGRPCGCLLCR